jgi:uncharacterized BrkB/YihY/UPF0761 family membrane protein
MASQVKSKNIFIRIRDTLDSFQQKHHFTAFTYAVFRKYSDDQAGLQAALIAYYGFVSLFPLLIVATSVIQLVTKNNAHLRDVFLSNTASYFPVLGNSLVDSINTPSRSGLALVIGLAITLYGTRGVAMALQHAQNHLWAVPRRKRAGFPLSLIKGFGLIFWGGIGFIAAASLTTYASGAGHAWPLRVILGFAGFCILFTVFWGILTFGSSARKHPFVSIRGALFAATGLLVLQALGGYLIGYQLRSQTGLNAQFAIVIALLFWLYLQAQVFLYAVEINTVRGYKLWPRSITPVPPLAADIKAYKLYHRREMFVERRSLDR